jgi:hypothetical protein
MAEFSDAKSGAYCTCTRERCSDECRTYRQFRPKPVTNADRIRAMSDEELAKKMSGLESFALTCGGGWPPEKWLEWLKQEVQE